MSPREDGGHSLLIDHVGKWIVAEFLRLAWNKDRNVVATIIEQIVQLEVPLIQDLDGTPLVLPRGISAPDEVLLLLYHAPSNRLTRAERRGYAANQKPQTVSTTISRLIKEKDIRATEGDEVALTPNGQKRLREGIIPRWAPKL